MEPSSRWLANLLRPNLLRASFQHFRAAGPIVLVARKHVPNDYAQLTHDRNPCDFTAPSNTNRLVPGLHVGVFTKDV